MTAGTTDELEDTDPDSDILIREVAHLTKTLIHKEGLTVEDKEHIITKLGHMAYMGKLSHFSLYISLSPSRSVSLSPSNEFYQVLNFGILGFIYSWCGTSTRK